MKTLCMPLALATAISGALFTQPTLAYEAGEIIMRFGSSQVAPDASSSQATANGATLAGATVDADSDTQLGLTAMYMFSRRLGFEVLAATPFNHTVTGSGGAINGVKITEAKQLPPTFSVIYYLTEGAKFQPYVGAGINYTTFFDERSAIGGSAELDDSVGLALQLGADYQIDAHWSLNASVRWIDIQTDATIEGSTALGAGIDVQTTVDIDPLVYSLMLGYHF